MKTRTMLFLCAGLMLVANSATAQVVFDGDAGDGLWETATNWNGDALPGTADNVQIHSGFSVGLSSSQTVTDFTVGSDGAGGTTGLVDHTAGTLSGSGTSWSKVGTDGAANVGTYNMSGSAALTNFDVFAVGIVDGTGTLAIQDAASLSTNTGFASGGNATINQTGGSISSGSWLGLSNFGGGTVNFNISGGSVAVTGGTDFFSVGEDGVGNLNVSGTAVVEALGQAMVVGRNDNSTGLLDITGSTATINVNDLRVDTAAGSSGTLSWIADANGVTEIVSADNTEFGDNALLVVDLTADSRFANWGTGPYTNDILLIDNAAGVTGTFLGFAEGASVDIGGGKTGTITYVGGSDGNDVYLSVLTTVPEPSSLALFGILGCAAFGRRRRS